MTWNEKTARTRIQKLLSSAPDITIERFAEDYLPRFLSEQKATGSTGKPLFNIPANKAIALDTVHVYVNFLNFDDYRLESGTETEASHKKALQFLHLHYGACDRVVESIWAQRVDFHGPRVHAVVIEPSGADNTQARIIQALELAKKMLLLSRLADSELAGGQFNAEFRIGIDAGPCVAINSGSGHEQEPLFLGGSANYAAKLAEGGTEPGIFVSDNVRTMLNMPVVGSFLSETQTAFENTLVEDLLSSQPETTGLLHKSTVSEEARRLLNEWQEDLRTQKMATGDNFEFHYHTPPLQSIDYAKLSPGNSIRMPLISVFADIDGFTRYIDEAYATGNVENAVKALYVMRGELNHVLEDDFGGRKVRFIGDCIHGVQAEGSSSVDDILTIRSSLRCAGAMRSSFGLCKEVLPGTENLGLAIGLEYGETPISRIGIRGPRSVRVASSLATHQSEWCQKSCNGKQTALGPKALQLAPDDVKQLFSAQNIVTDLDFDDASLALTDVARFPAIHVKSSEPEYRAHCQIDDE